MGIGGGAFCIYEYMYIQNICMSFSRSKLLQDVKTRSKHSGEDVIYGMGGLNEDVTRMYIYIHTCYVCVFVPAATSCARMCTYVCVCTSLNMLV